MMVFGKRHNFVYDAVFIIILIISSYFFGHFRVINEPADGIHVWRQSDGLSLALKYYEEGLSLLEPEMHNRLDGEGKAIGEFPVFYYLVAQLYKVFGVHHWVYRGLWLLIYWLGLFYLYKFASQFLKDKIWGIIVTLYTCGCPIYIIYGISFIPDPLALSIIFISWYYIYRYLDEWKNIHLILAILTCALAAVIKITILIPIIAFAAIAFMTMLIQRKKYQASFKKLFLMSIPFILVFAVVAIWYGYAGNYNEKYNTNYFFLRIAPIWELESAELQEVNERIKGWSREYISPIGKYVLYAMALFLIIPVFRKRFSNSHYFFYLFSVIGFLSFVALFYSQFHSHDYYVIGLLFIVPITMILFIDKLKPYLLEIGKVKRLAQLAGIVIVIFGLSHTAKRAEERFNFKSIWANKDLYELGKRLPEWGVSPEDLVIIPHDPSPNITLYPLNMDGWTALNFAQHQEVLDEKVQLGAKWMIISDTTFYNNELVQRYKDQLHAEFKGIRIYNIRKD